MAGRLQHNKENLGESKDTQIEKKRTPRKIPKKELQPKIEITLKEANGTKGPLPLFTKYFQEIASFDPDGPEPGPQITKSPISPPSVPATMRQN